MIGALAVIYAQEGGALMATIASQIDWAQGFSFMLFTLIYTPCLSTLATLRSEARSPAFTACRALAAGACLGGQFRLLPGRATVFSRRVVRRRDCRGARRARRAARPSPQSEAASNVGGRPSALDAERSVQAGIIGREVLHLLPGQIRRLAAHDGVLSGT